MGSHKTTAAPALATARRSANSQDVRSILDSIRRIVRTLRVATGQARYPTPAGTFEHCVHLRETTPLEPDVSHKYYASGIGMVKDDEFELVEKP